MRRCGCLIPAFFGLLTVSCLTPVLWASTPLSTSSSTLSTQPVRYPELHTACGSDDDCIEIENAECDNSTGMCTCLPNFSPISRTLCGRWFGDECYHNECHVTNAKCDNTTNKCVCEFGYSLSRDGTFCYSDPLMPGDLCDFDKNCFSLGENMECSQHQCVCKNNYYRWDTQCMEKIGTLGASCNVSSQICFQNGMEFKRMRECMNGICQCTKQYVLHDGTCKEKIGLLGAPCNYTKQACHIDSDGYNQRLHCYQGVCQCNKKYFLHKARCKRKIKALNTLCTDEKDICYKSTEETGSRICLNKICQCSEAFMHVQGFCLQKIGVLGASCNVTKQICHGNEEIQNMECINGVCQCKDGFVVRNTRCTVIKRDANGSSIRIFIGHTLIIALAIFLKTFKQL